MRLGGQRNDRIHQLRALQTPSLCTQKENIEFQLSIVLQISQQGLVVSMWIHCSLSYTNEEREMTIRYPTYYGLKNKIIICPRMDRYPRILCICSDMTWVSILVLEVVRPTKVIGPTPTLTDIPPQTSLPFTPNQIILDCQS